MAEPLTLAEFDALPDDEARDAAIARALGWRWREYGRVLGTDRPVHGWVRLTMERSERLHRPPAYWTGGDADPFANWGLLAEVCRALCTARSQYADLVLIALAPNGRWLVRDAALEEYADLIVREETPHRAACYALVAAGRVPKEG